MIRILLVDDQPVVLAGLKSLIDDTKQVMQVVGSTADFKEALLLAGNTTPDVILVDHVFIKLKITEVLSKLMEQTAARILLFTACQDKAIHQAAVLAGARGVVEKTCAVEKIVLAIEKVHLGQIWLDRESLGEILSNHALNGKGRTINPDALKIASLTKREKGIALKCGTSKLAVKALAHELHVSEHTLRNHLTSIYNKLGLVNRLDLFDFVQRVGAEGFE